MKISSERLRGIAWLTAALAVVPAVVVWLQGMGPGLVELTLIDAYSLFPLFGLLAFGLMWSHYVVAALRLMTSHNRSVTEGFTNKTGWAVLVFIVMHPTILIYSLWRDGLGLPPGSYSMYVAPHLAWAVALGSFSLLCFLAWELRRWFDSRRWWKYVESLSDIAMIFILVHGFKIGGELQSGWFRYAWLLYAVSLAVCLVIIYRHKLSHAKNVVG